MNLEERLYTSTEVAKVLGVSLRSVYRYLDQGKIDAEIKTATGRLRFTKQDILNFLYPNGDIDPSVIDSSFSKVEPTHVEENSPQPVDIPTASFEDSLPEEDSNIEEAESSDEEIKTETVELKEEEIDWLAKFRAAAKEYSMEKEAESPEPVKSEPAPQPTPQPAPEIDTLSSLDYSEEIENVPGVKCSYYKSMLGGLKEVAQNVDRIARKSAIDYAFTLYAGLSLEKPLRKPFSILHVYVNPSTEALFQKMLQLEEVEESNAQLCLMNPKNSGVFANKVEKHGLYVVDSDQMKKDFDLMGLPEEFEALL